MMTHVVGPCTTGDNASLNRIARQHEVIDLDSARFDELTRGLLSANSRREVVKTIAAGVGVSVGWLGLQQELTKARGKGKGKKKRRRKKHRHFNTKALLESCKTNKECVGDLLCQTANSQNGCPGNVGKVCCAQADVQAPCNDGCDCCGVSVICNGGYCDSA
jgi:hypothetical protein